MMPAPPVRRRKRRHGRSPVRKYWWLPLVLAGVGMIFWVATGPRWSRTRIDAATKKPITGYVASTDTMVKEYQHFYGKPLNSAETEKGFELANARVAAKDYTNAVGFLEQVSKVAAVPVVFNNLGVLYAELNDKSRA